MPLELNKIVEVEPNSFVDFPQNKKGSMLQSEQETYIVDWGLLLRVAHHNCKSRHLDAHLANKMDLISLIDAQELLLASHSY